MDEASQQLPTPPAAQAVQQEAHTAAAGRTGCTLEFKAYVPAAWEAQWRDRVGEWQPHMCPIMVAQKPRAKQVRVRVGWGVSLVVCFHGTDRLAC